MTIETILDNLDGFSIFAGIEAKDLLKVSELFESHSYARGYNIIAEGSQGNRFYIIAKGSAEVTVTKKAPNEATEAGNPGGDASAASDSAVRLAVLETGTTFGELALIDSQLRSATVTTIDPTETLEITNTGLLKIFERAPDTFRLLMMNIARDLSRRLRETDDRLAALMNTGKLPELRAES